MISTLSKGHLYKALVASRSRFYATVNSVQNQLPSDVTIVEVGPRDGLQNEKVNIIHYLSQ